MANRVRSVIGRVEKYANRLPKVFQVPVRMVVSFVELALRSVVGVESHDGVVALTFDDGPDPVHTPAILDVFRTAGGRATFFVLSSQAEMHPELVARIREDGHEVALHTCSHRDLTKLGLRELFEEIYLARRSLIGLSRSEVPFFRPPYGAQNLRSYLMTRISGMLPVLWDQSANDWEDVEAGQVAEDALNGLSDGGILLLHDGHCDPEHDTPPPTYDRAEAVRQILAGIEQRGMRSTTISELLEEGSPRNQLWFETDTISEG